MRDLVDVHINEIMVRPAQQLQIPGLSIPA